MLTLGHRTQIALQREMAQTAARCIHRIGQANGLSIDESTWCCAAIEWGIPTADKICKKGHTPKAEIRAELIRKECSTQPDTAPKSTVITPTQQEAAEIAQYLYDAIVSHSPELYQRWAPMKLAKHLEGWATWIERAIRIDKRTPDELRAVIDYAHRNERDTFWRANLQSGKGLREKFARIWPKVKPQNSRADYYESLDFDAADRLLGRRPAR